MTSPPPAPGARPAGMAALFAVHFGSAAMMRVCDPMLPALAHDFRVTTGQAAATVSAYAIAYGLAQFFFGPAGDRWGKRRVIGFAALSTVAGNLLALLAPSLEMLVVARVLSGAAAAGIIALVLAWVGDNVPYTDRQVVLARFLMASLTGMMAGQWVSGVVTEHVGWRAVFAALVLLLGTGGTLIVRDRGLRHEGRGATSTNGHLRALSDVLRVPWAQAMLAFVAIESALAFGAVAFLPAHLVASFGLSLSAAAGIVVLYGIGGLGYALAARWIVPRLGEAGIALAGGLLLGLAWLGLAAGTHWALALPAAAFAGLAFYSLHGLMQTHATQMVPALRGTAMALFAAAMFIGIAIGVSVAGQVVDAAGFRPLFSVCAAGLVLLGAVFAWCLRSRAAAAAPTAPVSTA